MSKDRRSVPTWWVVAGGALLGIASLALTVTLYGPQIEGLLAPAAWTVLVVGLSLQTLSAIRVGNHPKFRMIVTAGILAIVGAGFLLGVQQASQIALGWRAAIDLVLIAAILGLHRYIIAHPWISDALEQDQRPIVWSWAQASIHILVGGAILGPLASGAASQMGDFNPNGWIGQAVPYFTLFWSLWPFLRVRQPEFCQQVQLWKFLVISAIGSLIPAAAVTFSTLYGLSMIPAIAAVALGAVGGALLNRWLLSLFDGWIKR